MALDLAEGFELFGQAGPGRSWRRGGAALGAVGGEVAPAAHRAGSRRERVVGARSLGIGRLCGNVVNSLNDGNRRTQRKCQSMPMVTARTSAAVPLKMRVINIV